MAVSGQQGTFVTYLLSSADSAKVTGDVGDVDISGTQVVGIVKAVNGDGSLSLAVFGTNWIIHVNSAVQGSGNGQWQAIS